jgi:hypothetical protein
MRKLVYAGLILCFSFLLIAAGCQVTQPSPQPSQSLLSQAETVTYSTMFGNSLVFVHNDMIKIFKSPVKAASIVSKGGGPIPTWEVYSSHEVYAGYAYDTLAYYLKAYDQLGNIEFLVSYGASSIYKVSSHSAAVGGNLRTAAAPPKTTTTKVTTTTTFNFNPNATAISFKFGDPLCFNADGTPKKPTDLYFANPQNEDPNDPNHFDDTKFFKYQALWSGTVTLDDLSLSCAYAALTFNVGTVHWTVSSTNFKIQNLLLDSPTADVPIKIYTTKDGLITEQAQASLIYENKAWYLVLFNTRIWIPVEYLVRIFVGTTTSTTSTVPAGATINITVNEGSGPSWANFLSSRGTNQGFIMVGLYQTSAYPPFNSSPPPTYLQPDYAAVFVISSSDTQVTFPNWNISPGNYYLVAFVSDVDFGLVPFPLQNGDLLGLFQGNPISIPSGSTLTLPISTERTVPNF